MEARPSSRKRKQCSSAPFTGIFTRSRSEIFLHRNRSGRARSDPKSRRNYSNLTPSPQSSLEIPRLMNEDDFDDDIARISIKDLRARRVFSLASISEESCSDQKGGIGSYADETKPQFSVTEEKTEFFNGEQGINGDSEISCGVDGSSEDWFQTTPPDADVFCKSEVVENGGKTMELGLQSLEEPTSGNGEVFCSTKVGKNNNFNPKRRMEVLRPCSRMKLFKTPSSFSYRRLLPFLMDIAKDNSSAVKLSPSPEAEKSVERPLALDPLSRSPSEEIPIVESSMSYSSSMGNHIGDSGAPLIAKSREMTSTTGSSNVATTGSSNVEGPNLELCKQPIVESSIQNPPKTHSVSPLGSHNEWGLQVQQVLSFAYSQMKHANDAVGYINATDPPAMCSPRVNPEALLENDGAPEVTSLRSVEVEKDCMTVVDEFRKDTKPLEAHSLHQHSTVNKALVPSEKPVVGCTKGILKRNPRGCRGLCACLNCASFRLHAERAFEFSRNQMLDAEEVTVGLIKELSSLRSLLEKSADGAKDHFVEVNQVKGACRKATTAEEWAKTRLQQMSHDLNIHSRITCLERPKESMVKDLPSAQQE
ncbi:hypothetical protein HHK36_027153 [Tetracentron sinense]|uniref:Uncharacterized protein n=1 Tax=Tetracentron sinense TaxID=13715 RepID=A0A834YJZ4_TETSI|nr:hypothetical protein HHK36_027153 [Tetracentron sinense]